jgi:hypothetical protein
MDIIYKKGRVKLMVYADIFFRLCARFLKKEIQYKYMIALVLEYLDCERVQTYSAEFS